ncbi:MAG: ABC transporter substrate-binding protein [Roseiflexaceae bacterium]|nr:ABC transporter substrate-binding protein [Roseiflexaceae bacterium]
MTTRLFRPLNLLLPTVLVLAACGQVPAAVAPTAAPAAVAPTAASSESAPVEQQASLAPELTSANAPAQVRLAYFPNLTHAAALVGTAEGTFQQAFGSSVALETITFNAGPALIEALFAGEVDLGYIGPNPAINGYVQSKGDALRIIAGASSGGASFVVRPESNIASAKDLEGKKLATPQLGGTQDVALRFYLQQNGLSTADKGGTVEIVPTQNPDILTLFQQGLIDGAWVPEPWATRLVQEGGGKVFIDERTIWPEGQFVTTNIIVRREFLEQYPDVVTRFLEAHVATVQYIAENDEATKSIVNAEIERITGSALPREVLDSAYPQLEVTYDPLANTLFKSADDAFALGFLGTDKPDLSGLYALDPLNAVLNAKGLAPVAPS